MDRPVSCLYCLFPILSSTFLPAKSFLHPSPFASGTLRRPPTRVNLLDVSASSLTTAVVEVFDGSTIVDPVVVSNVFWMGLKAKLLSLIIGQLLSIVVFTILASVAANQLARLGDYVTKQLFSSNTAMGSSTNQQPLKVPPNLRNPPERIIQPDFGKLMVCIAVDVIGSSSELIPILGEVTDIVWAPVAGLILRSLYGSNVIFALEIAEEILPFTDILPLATVCWVVDTFFADSNLARILGLGQYGNGRPAVVESVEEIPRKRSNTGTVIDVTGEFEPSRQLPPRKVDSDQGR